jgi:hypothetical protein
MVINLAHWRAGHQRIDRKSTGHLTLGRPVISTARCANCGRALLGFPKWREAPREGCKRATAEGGGWVEVEVRCGYGCRQLDETGMLHPVTC